MARSKSNRQRALSLGRSLAAGAAGLGLTLASERGEACSCLPPSVESSYGQSTDVVLARVLTGFNVGAERWYLASVEQAYKGCLGGSSLVILTTARDGAACGVALEAGESYLLNGLDDASFLGIPRLGIGLCGYNVLARDLTEHDREFLRGRTVCCGDECQCADGSAPVACFVDPCSVAPACSEAVECVANYCGGCNAEFYDASGYAVCQGASSCVADADCPADQWCRQAPPEDPASPSDPRFECVPFAFAGESCEGFTLPWDFDQCEPSLVCDHRPFIADAPGICHAPCLTDADCALEEYCASDGLCDADGGCEISADCNLDGNSFVHPACVGYGVCGELGRGCGWQCGAPGCADTSGYDFGPCDAVLGWGVNNGNCVELSGCASGPFELFATSEQCEAACESGG